MQKCPLAFLLAAFLAAGCSAAASRSVRPIDLFGSDRPSSRVSDHDFRLPENAATFTLAAGNEALPPELESYVTSLLERRGWSLRTADGSADLEVLLSDGSKVVAGIFPVMREPAITVSQMRFDASTYGSGDVLDRRVGEGPVGGARVWSAPVRQSLLGVQLVAAGSAGPAWEALAWSDLDTRFVRGAVPAGALDSLATSRLLTALADRLPAAPAPSSERVAVDEMGADLLILPQPGGDSLPVVLSVRRGSAAASAGWRPRDLLLDVGGASARGQSWAEIARRLAVAEREPVRVELLRGGERYLTFLVPMPVLRPLP